MQYTFCSFRVRRWQIGKSVTIASNGALQIGSSSTQSLIVETNSSEGVLTINGGLSAGVAGSKFTADKSGTLNLNLATGSDLMNLTLETGPDPGGMINIQRSINSGGMLRPNAGGAVNITNLGVTIGSTTALNFGANGTLALTHASGTSTFEGLEAIS